jgi:hypothetical protein
LASTSSTSSSSSSHSSKTGAGAIAGGAVGCVFGGALISALLFWLYTKHRASRPDPRASLQTSEHRIMDLPPSTGLPAVNSLPSLTDMPAIPSPPPLIDSPAPVQQVYQDTLQKTYVSIRRHHLTWDADMDTVAGSRRRYPYILYNPTPAQRRGPAWVTSQHRIWLGSSWTILC